MMSDPWCSCGALQSNGDLINSGGAIEGMRALRTLSMKQNSDFQENLKAFAADRWYIHSIQNAYTLLCSSVPIFHRKIKSNISIYIWFVI